MKHNQSAVFLLILTSLLFPLSNTFAESQAQAGSSGTEIAADDGLSQLSIEQLVNLVVTSPGKKEERFNEVSAALFVITAEDIRRSGKTTLPEILRMVPGISVLRVDGNQWAISSRGFTSVFSDKLLVLLDGRSVYTPLYGGVFWNEVDSMLEDIERIEVIRGPGATLYGANAVNGVINIITKNSKDTHGNLLSAGGGTTEKYFANFRHGDKVGDTNYRAYAKYWNRDGNQFETPLVTGGNKEGTDSWRGVQSGFRTDTRLSRSDNLTIQGDGYYGEPSGLFAEATADGQQILRSNEARYVNGANILSKWNRKLSDRSDIEVKFYFDHMERDDVSLLQKRNTWDIDFQHRLAVGESHDVLYGAEYRIYSDDNDGNFYTRVEPDSRTVELITGFVQDDITLVPDRWKLTVGSKVEYTDLSGVEVLPSVRVAYTPNTTNTWWAAASRAVRTPQRFNQDGILVLGSRRLPTGLPAAVVLNGSDSYDSEYLYAYEAGYRTQFSSDFSADLALFYNDYNDLESVEPDGTPFLDNFQGQPYLQVPYRTDNLLEGHALGAELALEWRPIESWRLIGSYAYLHLDLMGTKGSQDFAFLPAEGRTPQNQFMIRSQLNLPLDVEFDTALRWVDNVPEYLTDSYWELDARVGWRPSKSWEFAVVGENLINKQHSEVELVTFNTPAVQIERAVYGKVTYRF